MALWGVEVKPGEAYVHEPSNAQSYGRLRITQATLGNFDYLGWSMLEGRAGKERLARLCALHPTSNPMCHLNLELEEDESVVFSVHGQSSIHLSGHYMHSKPTGTTAATPTISKKNHQKISDNSGNRKKPRREDAPLISDSDHGSNNERNNGSEEIDVMRPPASHKKKGVVEKPSGIAATGSGLKEYIQVSDTDDTNETTLNPEADDGLKIDDIIKGHSGAQKAANGCKVTVQYVGWLKNGKIIDRSRRDFTFKLGAKRIIPGWNLGILGMRVGGKRRLTIPPSLAYDDSMEQYDIPPNSWLIYDIALKNVE